MLQYMMQAQLGDDVFNDDPTVHALQDKVVNHSQQLNAIADSSKVLLPRQNCVEKKQRYVCLINSLKSQIKN